jgi:hypothetical protein
VREIQKRGTGTVAPPAGALNWTLPAGIGIISKDTSVPVMRSV